MDEETAGLELAPLRAELRARGFTHVLTAGGTIPVDTWDPYGAQGVNAGFFAGSRPWRGVIQPGADAACCYVDDVPRLPASDVFVWGRWTVLREETASDAGSH